MLDTVTDSCGCKEHEKAKEKTGKRRHDVYDIKENDIWLFEVFRCCNKRRKKYWVDGKFDKEFYERQKKVYNDFGRIIME